jgi:HEAT repeat protein
MKTLVIAVLGGVIVLAVQGTTILLRQWRHRIRIGEIEAARGYVYLRRLAYAFIRRRIVRSLRRAAEHQRGFIEAQYAQDPMWRVVQLRLVPESLDPQASLRKLTLAEALAADDEARGIFVTGESGSGRSSVSSLTAVQWSKTPLALRIDLSSYNPREPVLDQALNGWVRRRDLDRGMALGLVALIFDSFEALRGEDARAAFDADLRRIRWRYPDVRIAVLARPEDMPTRMLLATTGYTMSALSAAEVQEVIASLGFDPAAVLRQLDDRTQALCSSPLMLRMVLLAYSEEGAVPTDHTILHREFVYALIADPAEAKYALPRVSSSAKLEFVAELAFSCENRTATFDYPRAQRVIRPMMVEMVSTYVLPATIDQAEVLRDLVRDGILQSDGRVLRFVHYSVQEFLAAVALHRRLAREAVDLEFVADLSTQREWRNSIVFLSGLLADSTDLVQHLRSKNRVLAAECIKTASSVDPAFVDKCIVEALYEYKFGEMSYYDDLVFALMLISDRCSQDIPPRIVSELRYWCQKYPPQPYCEMDGIDNAVLLSLLRDDGASPQAVNAVWTLGLRGRIEAAPCLEAFLRDRVDQLSLVSALALGKLKSRSSAQLLLSTALDPQAPASLRSACFSSIGQIGAKDCLPAIGEFIRSGAELDGPVREDAAWSLNGLVDDLLIASADFQDMLVRQLSVGTVHARAMFAYLIGRFKVPRGLDSLMAYARDPDTDLFLLEDVIFSIGELADDRAEPVIRALLAHPDNIVRARAIEAAGKLPGFADDELKIFATDAEPSEIVRDSARGQLRGDPVAGAMPAPVDVRRRR